jgi:hypothetical protein
MKQFIPVRLINGRWKADLIEDHKAVAQLREEAGLKFHKWPDPSDAYDRLLSAASAHGFGLETAP